RIEEEVDPLTRGQFAGLVLPLEPRLTAAQLGEALQVLEIFESIHINAEWRMLNAESGSSFVIQHSALMSARSRAHPLALFPVLQEVREPDVGERMVEQRVDHLGRTGADVGAEARRLDDVHRAAGR